jgi:drug/metabolite transporter (DMT)-like permease
MAERSNPPPLQPERHPVSKSSALLALLAAALWGGNPVAVQFTVDTLPPIAVAALRFAMASVFMLVWCRFEGSRLGLRSGQAFPAIVAGLLLFVQITTFNIGTWLSNSSHSAMLISTFVFWVALLDHLLGRDRLTPRKTAGLLSAAAGGAIVFWSAGTGGSATPAGLDPASLSGDAILLASALVLGFQIVYVKQALRIIEPGKLIFWQDLVSVLLFTVSSLLFEQVAVQDFTLSAVLGLAYQGIFVAGLCFAIQAVLLRRHSASQIAIFHCSTPLFGVTLGVLLRGDPVSPWLLLSAVFVAMGIWLVNSK